MSTEKDENKTPEEIEAEIAQTRADLGDTVAAAADKADVKKQTKKKAQEIKSQAKDKADELKEKASDLKDKATDQAADLKDKAGDKLDEAKDGQPGGIKDTAEQIAGGSGPFAGTGGDAGSGPTGDLYQPVPDTGHNALIIGGALLAGFILGRMTVRR